MDRRIGKMSKRAEAEKIYTNLIENHRNGVTLKLLMNDLGYSVSLRNSPSYRIFWEFLTELENLQLIRKDLIDGMGNSVVVFPIIQKDYKIILDKLSSPNDTGWLHKNPIDLFENDISLILEEIGRIKDRMTALESYIRRKEEGEFKKR